MNIEVLKYAGGKGSGVRLAPKSCTISPPQDYPHCQGSLLYSRVQCSPVLTQPPTHISGPSKALNLGLSTNRRFSKNEKKQPGNRSEYILGKGAKKKRKKTNKC